MTIADEVERLRKKAAELVEQAIRRDRRLLPEEDAEILALLKEARELETSDNQQRKKRSTTNSI